MCHSVLRKQLIVDQFAHSHKFPIGAVAWP